MDEYLQRIRDDGFEPITSYQIIQTGWTNVVVELNDEWIFRFARDPQSKQFLVERDFLREFSKSSVVRVPNPRENSHGYMAYRKIRGDKLIRDRVICFSERQQKLLVQSLGQFLTQLHESDYRHTQLAEAPYGGSDFWGEIWPLVEGLLFRETRGKAGEYFERTLETLKSVSINKTITHSDLGTSNILLNYHNHSLSGIIDFGDLCMTDPAVDFAGFYRHFGRGFVEQILQYYGRPVGDEFWRRVDYHSKRKLFFLIYFAVTHGFQEYVPNIVTSIEALFGDAD